jgi:FkbM family methyltransferase
MARLRSKRTQNATSEPDTGPLKKTKSVVLTFLAMVLIYRFVTQKELQFQAPPPTTTSTTKTTTTPSPTPQGTTPVAATVVAAQDLVADPVLAASLVRLSGDGWTVNQVPPYEYSCRWLDYRATSGKVAKFCGHSDPDGVTESIATRGHFHHCNVLPSLWNSKDLPKTPNSIYLEIGANIGSCVVEMLLSTDAKIILFEPHPKNLFCIHQTLQANHGFSDRVVIVPVALGGETSHSTIFAATGNMGNSVVGKIIKDNPGQAFDQKDQHKIPIERLDSIITNAAGTNIDIPLVKMDAQGFECHIVNGINIALAQQIYKIKFEVSRNHLRNQECNDLLEKLRQLDFQITLENGTPVQGEWQQFTRMMELHAVRNSNRS